MIFMLKAVIGLVVLAVTLAVSVKINGDRQRGDFPLDFKRRRLITGLSMFLIYAILLAPAVGTVSAGYRGVVLRFGAVTGEILDEGIYMVTPIAESVEQMSVQVEAEASKAGAASRDLQQVHTEVTVNYFLNPDRAATVYKDLRREAVIRIVKPAIQESVKAATALYDAEQLIVERQSVKEKIESLLRSRLAEHGFSVDAVNITDFDFSSTFNAAIEAKVQAVQEALQAKNELEKVKMQAEQKITNAKAEAESLRLQREQITPQMLSLRMIEAQLEALKKWDGRLPQEIIITGDGSAPIPILPLLRNQQIK